jgi:hypothetical protein
MPSPHIACGLDAPLYGIAISDTSFSFPRIQFTAEYLSFVQSRSSFSAVGRKGIPRIQLECLQIDKTPTPTVGASTATTGAAAAADSSSCASEVQSVFDFCEPADHEIILDYLCRLYEHCVARTK